jgi:hypothetical protein
VAQKSFDDLFPLQSLEYLVELDKSRYRNLPLRLCGWPGLQSFHGPASSVYLVQHSLFVLLLTDAP